MEHELADADGRAEDEDEADREPRRDTELLAERGGRRRLGRLNVQCGLRLDALGQGPGDALASVAPEQVKRVHRESKPRRCGAPAADHVRDKMDAEQDP